MQGRVRATLDCLSHSGESCCWHVTTAVFLTSLCIALLQIAFYRCLALLLLRTLSVPILPRLLSISLGSFAFSTALPSAVCSSVYFPLLSVPTHSFMWPVCMADSCCLFSPHISLPCASVHVSAHPQPRPPSQLLLLPNWLINMPLLPTYVPSRLTLGRVCSLSAVVQHTMWQVCRHVCKVFFFLSRQIGSTDVYR